MHGFVCSMDKQVKHTDKNIGRMRQSVRRKGGWSQITGIFANVKC